MGKAGSMLGSGAMIVIAEGTCMVRLLQVLTRFYAHESCGQCTPCREGTDWMNRILERIVAGQGDAGGPGHAAARSRRASWATPICALGDAASMPVLSFVKKFGDRVRALRRARPLAARRPPDAVNTTPVKLTIDQREIEARDGETVLQAARRHGIDIPHFCYHDKLSIAGNCRICLVKVNGLPKLHAGVQPAGRAEHEDRDRRRARCARRASR